MIGETLGHYKIVRLLGKGGMGEVYVADDTKLNRQVALKVLPPELAGDPERRARFEREAQAVAALNHPNIVTIHSVEEIGGTHFITMELVKGKALSDLIPSNGFPLNRFLEQAIPLSDAVAVAHQNGVTHRDLKPENVMVGDDGRLRVLDFGLTKLAEGPINADSSGSDDMPTQTVTREGRVLGTVAYMSPEQAEGKSIDHRTDIFSLGVMFYEMATGQKPFSGDTSMSVLTAIIRDDPGSVTDLNVRLPRQLGRFVKRCLQKDPDRRYQSALDLRNELEELQEEVATGQVTPVSAATVDGGAKNNWLVPIALVLAAIGVGFGLWSVFGNGGKGSEEPAATEIFQSMQIRSLTSSGSSSQVAISPDGKYVAYLSEEGRRPSLRIKQVATGSDVEIVPPEDVWFRNVLFSRDGDYVLYQASALFDAQADLYQIPTLGGTPRKLLSDVGGYAALSFDGQQVVFLRDPSGGMAFTRSIWVANLDGTGESKVAEIDEGILTAPAWSPDGEHIAFGRLDFTNLSTTFMQVPVQGGELEGLSDEAFNGLGALTWLPDGKGLIATAFRLGLSGPQIWEIEYPGGEIQRVTNDLNTYVGASLTADGLTLATVQSETRSSLWTVDITADGSVPTTIPTTTGSDNGSDGVAWLADGQIIYTADEGTERQIWIMQSDGSDARRLSLQGRFNGDPTVHPDGQSVAYTTFSDGRVEIVRTDLGGGALERLTEDEMIALTPYFSPDGSELLYQSIRDGRMNLLRRPVTGGEGLIVTEGTFSHSPSFSPDGSKLAIHMVHPDDGRFRTAILPAGGGEPLELFEFHSEQRSPWGPDSNSLYHTETREGTMNIYLMPLDGGAPRQLTHFTEGEIFDFDISPDHTQLLIARGETLRDIVLIENFR